MKGFMLPKLYKFVVKRGSLSILMTLLVMWVVATIKGEVSPSDVLLVLLVVVIQSFLRVCRKLYSRAAPIERLSAGNRMPNKRVLSAMLKAISFIPILLLAYSLLGWLALLMVSFYVGWQLLVVLRRLVNSERIADKTLSDLESLRPRVAVYISGLRGVAYQINQWLPVLHKLGVETIIVVRQRGIYEGMSDTEIPVVYARNMAHVEKVLQCGIRTVLYPANTMHNVQALRQYQLNHFFINHGESDKAVNQSKLLQAYDKLLVAGPLAHRRLMDAGLALRDRQVEYVGRPQAELLLEQASDKSDRDVYKVLYAPTWEGFVDNVDYSSIGSLGLGILKTLAAQPDVNVVFKPHPYTGSRQIQTATALAEMKSFCVANGIKIEESLSSIYECMNASDMMITDVSSVLNDYLITRKPVVVCVNEMMEELPLDEQFPTSRAAYKLSAGNDVTDLISAIRYEDPLAQVRAELRIDSLGDFPEGAFARFRRVIQESVADAVQ
jgi:BarA-like signal transduction histidine kinase